MNHPDRLNGPLPARAKDYAPTPMPHDVEEYGADPYAPTSSNKITMKLVGRALKRHWWQALLLWIVGSVGLMIVAYQRVKPTFDAFATILVDRAELSVYSDKSRILNFDEYKETQVKSITNPNVLSATLSADPTLLQLPRLREAIDPEAEIRSAIIAMIVPKTSYIQVSMSSESPEEATRLVDAVVTQYLKQANDFNDSEIDRSTKRLRELKDDHQKKVDDKRRSLIALMKKGEVGDAIAIKERNTIDIERYSDYVRQLTAYELDLVEAEAQLAALQADPAVANNNAPATEPQMTQQEKDAAFLALPAVAEVRRSLNAAIRKKESISRITRNPLSDPAYLAADKSEKQLKAQLDQLWLENQPLIEQSKRTAPMTGVDGALRDADRKVQGIRSRINQLQSMLTGLKITTRSNSQELMALELNRTDLQIEENNLQTVQKQLSQAEFDAKNPQARIQLVHGAKGSNRPNTNNRTKIMAAAPFGMMVLVVALLVILELSAGRVVDPDDLPGRVHVPVLGVVPPLPQVQAANGLFSSRDEFRAQRQLDQFVQSLDHLRVALTSGRTAFGRERRCVLITSACGSEGKTTLAAQLAERCVNAGLMTLLIDADLRNPTLSRMLDVATNRGLINILRGETILEEAMTVVGGAGGFHFLPAGTPKVDPSRLLHGDRLAKLLTQARESFDIVIVDAPPVLPVPDALTIGRWTDGAILAVRYDTSRFPLVERANKRLASVGVPVIGAVVNGVRIVESTYGSYYPSYAYSNDKAAQTPLDV